MTETMVDETGGTTGPADTSNGNAQKRADTAAPQSSGAAAPIPGRSTEAAMKSDIQNILKDIRLPERREATLQGEKKYSSEVKPIDSLLAGAAPAPAEAPEPEQPPQEAPKPSDTKVVGLHTLKDDLQGVVSGQKISVVRAAALEEEKRRGPDMRETIPPPQQSHRLRTALTLAGFLSVLGIAALLGVYYVVEQKAAPLPVQQSDSLVFAESSVNFTLDPSATPETLKSQLATARQKSGSLGSITRIIPVVPSTNANGQAAQIPATFSQFMSAIGAHVPDELLRAVSDTFFLGMHTVDKNAPVIIVPVTSYEHAFSGMLAWESSMNTDLSPFFLPVSQYMTVDGIPQARTFTDSVYRNYDVRQLTDDSGAVVLYYSFPTRTILIIAESPYTFTEILSRLQAQRAL